MTSSSDLAITTAPFLPDPADDEIRLLRTAVFLGTSVRHISLSASEVRSMFPNTDGGLTIPWGATAVDFAPSDVLLDSRFGEALVEFARSLLLEGPDEPEPKVLVAALLHTLPLKVGLAMLEDWEAHLVGATYEAWQDRFAAADTAEEKFTVIAARYMQSGAGVLEMRRLQDVWRTTLSDDDTLPGRDTETLRLLYDELQLAEEAGVVTLESFSSVHGLTSAMVEHQQAIQRAENPVVISNDEWARLVALTRQENPDPVIDYVFHRRAPIGEESMTPKEGRSAAWAQESDAQAHRAAELGQTYLEYRIPAIGDMPMESVIALRSDLTDGLERFRECLLDISASAPLASGSRPDDLERFFSQARGELEHRERELLRLVEKARPAEVARRSAPKLVTAAATTAVAFSIPELLAATVGFLGWAWTDLRDTRDHVKNHPLHFLYQIR